MSTTKKLWRVEYGITAPYEVEVDGRRDATGATVYGNTHYESEEDAWASLLENAEAGESLAIRSVRYAEAQLDKARLEAVEASKVGVATRAAKKKRDAQKGGPKA